MLVDPNTGLPIEGGGPEGVGGLIQGAMGADRSTAGAISALGQEAGLVRPHSMLDKTLHLYPSLTKTTLWNAYRGTRTIGYGAKGIDQATSLTATFSPRYLRKMPSMKALGGRSVESKPRFLFKSKYAAGESYTPFNVLAKEGNRIFNGIGKLANRSIARAAASEVNGVAVGEAAAKAEMNATRYGRAKLRISGYAKESEILREGKVESEAFNAGALSRFNAAHKIAQGRLPTSNVMSFLEQTDSRLYKATSGIRHYMGLGEQALTNKESAHLIAMTNSGRITGRMSGFMTTLRTGALDTVGSEGSIARAGRVAGATAYRAGSESAVKFMENIGVEATEKFAKSGAKAGFRLTVKEGGAIAEKLGLKEGGKVGAKVIGQLVRKGEMKLGAKAAAALGLQAAPVVGQILGAVMLADMAMDVGKFAAEGIKSGIDFAKDAAISYKGTINKGVMGMGYRDNTVAATSRARGVQAIQNSRLNARSVLGSEAGAMAAHFG